tara:strand:- start:316 stop:1785 length:1470 start_codon:yes stop_codon:yes gene_type:complete
MAIIYTYPSKTDPAATDLLLISDSEDENKTKKVTISDIRGATVSGVSSIIAGTSNVTLSPVSGTGDVTISVSGSSDAVIETVRNNSGATIEKGQPLHITGVSGITPTVEVADASDPAKMPVSGLANQQILNNTDGEMIISGVLNGIDTANIDGSPAEAAVIYVNTTTGGSIDFLSANNPTTEANLIQNIGIVVKSSPGTSGSIQVTAIGRTNATPNLNQGSIFIGNGTNQPTTLPIGSNTYVLGSNGTTASWGTTIGIASQPLTGTTRLEVGGLVRTNDGEPAEPAYSFTGNTNTGMYNGVSNDLNFAVSGGNVLSMRAALIQSLVAHVFDSTAGLRFGGNGDTLNSYEEGTWTPTADQVIGDPPTTASSSGTYTRIGNIVHITFELVVTGSSTLNAGALISGLPFTPDNAAGSQAAGSLFTNTDSNTPNSYPSTFSVGAGYITLYLEGSAKLTNTIPLGLKIDAAASWHRPTAGTGITLRGSAMYKVA